MWDGFQRINTDTKAGGIIGVFRHGAQDTKRIVRVKDLNLEKRYQVKQMDGKVVTTQTGSELSTNGFEVSLYKIYDGELFEISSLN